MLRTIFGISLGKAVLPATFERGCFDVQPRRNEFENNATIDKKDFGAIEYLLRKGQRQLETYSEPGIRNIVP